MKKRLIACTMAVIVVAGLFAGCGKKESEKSPADSDTIKIGVGVPMTGGSAELGKRVFNGAELAVEEINEAGGVNGKKIELVSMDDKADPKEAANVAKLFVADEEIIACIAGYNSSCTLSGAPIYNDAGLVHIAVGSSSPKVSEAGDYTFRVWNSDIYRASFDLDLIINAGYEKIGIIYQNDDFGQGALKVAQDSLKEKGIEPLVAEGYLLGETIDFNTVITKMMDADCEAVFAIADETELAAFAKQCAQQGYKPFISATGTYNPSVISLGGDAVEGMVGDGYFDPDNMPEKAVEFFDKYNEKYSANGERTEDPTSPCAYAAIYMIKAAVEDGAKTREDVQKYLADLKDFDTVVGSLSYDENGDVKIPLVAIQIKDGAFAAYK
ncbi:MAG: ABC transporter substrate-binding protein [Lachnospiraceae bacterium]|nr:ABC transporter substrate-binding protein [Lachnospiraceae bacterium]